MSEYVKISDNPLALSGMFFTHIYFGILKTFLQIPIDSFIRYLADEGKIRNSHFLLFSTFEYRFLDLWLASTTRSVGIARLADGVSLLLATGSLCDRLFQSQYLNSKKKRRYDPQSAYHCYQSQITPKTLSIIRLAKSKLCTSHAGWQG